MPQTPLILASGSRYRRQQLERLGLAFTARASDVDETPLPGESVQALVARLGQAKARAVADQLTPEQPPGWIIGSDQAACVDGEQTRTSAILGKPGTPERAVAQLSQLAGKRVCFYTSLCLLHTHRDESFSGLDETIVTFRPLRRAEIEDYVRRDNPIDCAGGFKSEALGVALFDSVESTDPNALIGLPLILLSKFLLQAGCPILAAG